MSADLAIVGASRKLKVSTASASPLRTLSITADELIVKDGQKALLLTQVDETADIQTSGPNGLDKGAEAASTWYYLWVIAKDNATAAAILSKSVTQPQMPHGYRYKALVSAVRNNDNGDFVAYDQQGHAAFYQLGILPGTQNVMGTEQALDLSSFVPPIAATIRLGVHNLSGRGQSIPALGFAVDAQVSVRFIAGVNFVGMRVLAENLPENGGASTSGSSVEIPNISQRVYYMLSANGGTSIQVNIGVNGFTLS